ncbi:MAG TPA: biopolymer transporter TolR [Opitutaceae bacterium]|jgi:Tol biopolymer transport system component
MSSLIASAFPHLSLFAPLCCALAVGAIVPARASEGGPVGVFDQHGDVGTVGIAGSTTYDADSQTYLLSSSGANMWADHDAFQFAWKKVSGDFILQAFTEFWGVGADPHRKMGLIVRASLDPRSPQVNACRHGSGLMALQFRKTEGAPTEEIHLPVEGADVLQLERSGRTFTVSVARFGDTFTTQSFDAIDLPDEVYVGIYLCSHNDAAVEKGVFRNVRLVRPAKPDFRPYRDYIGSDIELLDVATGTRKTILRAEDSLQAPNWTPDRRRLIYNQNGRIYSLDLATRATAVIDTGAQVHNNNDHALSFDGTMLGISSGPTSRVYTVPIGGGTPTQITPTGPSYLHGWSPDGKLLVFTGQRNGAFDIYRVPAAGGPEVRLTSNTGLNDGSEYTPDGKTIFFISNRTGRMQIWRMNADGSDQTQMTDDAYNNWFPHVSPDGKTIVFISFPPETKSDDHPFYRRVYLRKMPVAGGKPSVVAYVYGGQGSINVNSWSPDNATLAFVSNSGTF